MSNKQYQTVQDMWLKFAERAIPNGTTTDRWHMMYQAFLGGVWCIMNNLAEIGSDDSMPDEEGASRIRAWFDEVVAIMERQYTTITNSPSDPKPQPRPRAYHDKQTH